LALVNGQSKMRSSPERAAWTVLFAALFACIALAVGIPAAGLSYLNSATNNAFMRVSLQSGILKSYSPLESAADARVVDLGGREFKEDHTVVAGDRSVGLLTFAPGEGAAPYISVQMYSNASVRALRARTPRFDFAAAADEFDIELAEGRIDILARPPEGHRFALRITAAPGEVQITTPGQYTLELISDRLRVTSRDGEASLSAASTRTTLDLKGDQTATIEAESGRILPAPAPSINLVRNGFFQSTLTRDWNFHTDVNADGAVRGTVSRVGGAPSLAPGADTGTRIPAYLVFERVGENIGWGRTSLSQLIDEDVRGGVSLRLRTTFTILEQQLDVCGSEGTECPLMIRIDYVTQDGRDDFWLQGFYAKGDPSAVRLPDYVRSNFKGNHIAKPAGSQQVFESENLLQQIGNLQTVKSITVYAEGHVLRTRVDSIELLLQE
jgi:hypothetical protein